MDSIPILNPSMPSMFHKSLIGELKIEGVEDEFPHFITFNKHKLIESTNDGTATE